MIAAGVALLGIAVRVVAGRFQPRDTMLLIWMIVPPGVILFNPEFVAYGRLFTMLPAVICLAMAVVVVSRVSSHAIQVLVVAGIALSGAGYLVGVIESTMPTPAILNALVENKIDRVAISGIDIDERYFAENGIETTMRRPFANLSAAYQEGEVEFLMTSPQTATSFGYGAHGGITAEPVASFKNPYRFAPRVYEGHAEWERKKIAENPQTQVLGIYRLSDFFGARQGK